MVSLGRYGRDHLTNCHNKKWNYKFATDDEGKFICLCGCPDKFVKEDELAKHLVSEHRDQLVLIGCDPARLQEKFQIQQTDME